MSYESLRGVVERDEADEAEFFHGEVVLVFFKAEVVVSGVVLLGEVDSGEGEDSFTLRAEKFVGFFEGFVVDAGDFDFFAVDENVGASTIDSLRSSFHKQNNVLSLRYLFRRVVTVSDDQVELIGRVEWDLAFTSLLLAFIINEAVGVNGIHGSVAFHVDGA